MKKIFLAVLVLGCVSAQLLFAADDKRKGFSFYSKSQKQEANVQVKAEEKAEVKAIASENLAVAEKAEVVSEQAVEVVKVEAVKVEAVKVEAVKVEAASEVVPAAIEEAAPEVKVSPVAAEEPVKAAPVKTEPIKVSTPEKAPVAVISAEQKHQENLNALTQRLANNKSMTDAEKNSLAELMISQSAKDVDFRAQDQEKTVLFFEATGNDPNMTVEQKKQALKKGPEAPKTETIKPLVSEAKEVVTEPVQTEAKETPKEAPKKFKFF